MDQAVPLFNGLSPTHCDRTGQYREAGHENSSSRRAEQSCPVVSKSLLQLARAESIGQTYRSPDSSWTGGRTKGPSRRETYAD